ncbi:MAG: serine kinase [Bacteroidales bacterium]|jgi:serine kinase of HPr protein (carbohydrate metabolism regulator)|nr:serine kinase [Bacteroidales bacterium]
MTVRELTKKANLSVFSGEKGLDAEITGGYTCDLLSDVMGHAESGNVWITLQTHKNVMAIASLKELSAVILVKDQQPDEDTLHQSETENIPVLGTSLQEFEISGILYNLIKS